MESVLIAIAIFAGSVFALYKLFGGTASGASTAEGGFATDSDAGGPADSGGSGE